MKEALATLDATGDTGDLLSAMAVPCRGVIDEPRNSRCLRLRLTGVEFSREELERSPRQSVQSLEQGTAEIVVVSARSVPIGDGAALPRDELERLLAPSPYIQSTAPRMREEAARIVAGAENQSDKALAIYEWVHRNVAKEMTVSLPSALDVLDTLKGDCNEHTYLFVALCRAVGLPAKVMVGLAYHEGAFYYHAWPAVHVGRWFEMDPTWGQEAVDATHIAFVEGELAGQLQLVKIMGRLKIEALGE